MTLHRPAWSLLLRLDVTPSRAPDGHVFNRSAVRDGRTGCGFDLKWGAFGPKLPRADSPRSRDRCVRNACRGRWRIWLVPVLLLLYPDRDPKTITAMSLLVVFANATSGSIAYARQRRIDFRSGGWFALAALPGATAGAILVDYIPRRLFDAMFAGALLLLGGFLLVRAPVTTIVAPVSGRGVVRRQITDADGNSFVYAFQMWKGLAISAGLGFLSSLLGIGGGIVHVPVMSTVLHFPVHLAAATSHFVLAFMSAEGTAIHVATGTLSWDRALVQALFISAGAIPGAQIGAHCPGGYGASESSALSPQP